MHDLTSTAYSAESLEHLMELHRHRFGFRYRLRNIARLRFWTDWRNEIGIGARLRFRIWFRRRFWARNRRWTWFSSSNKRHSSAPWLCDEGLDRRAYSARFAIFLECFLGPSDVSPSTPICIWDMHFSHPKILQLSSDARSNA
jgi:hypothetical protein